MFRQRKVRAFFTRGGPEDGNSFPIPVTNDGIPPKLIQFKHDHGLYTYVFSSVDPKHYRYIYAPDEPGDYLCNR